MKRLRQLLVSSARTFFALAAGGFYQYVKVSFAVVIRNLFARRDLFLGVDMYLSLVF